MVGFELILLISAVISVIAYSLKLYYERSNLITKVLFSISLFLLSWITIGYCASTEKISDIRYYPIEVEQLPNGDKVPYIVTYDDAGRCQFVEISNIVGRQIPSDKSLFLARTKKMTSGLGLQFKPKNEYEVIKKASGTN